MHQWGGVENESLRVLPVLLALPQPHHTLASPLHLTPHHSFLGSHTLLLPQGIERWIEYKIMWLCMTTPTFPIQSKQYQWCPWHSRPHNPGSRKPRSYQKHLYNRFRGISDVFFDSSRILLPLNTLGMSSSYQISQASPVFGRSGVVTPILSFCWWCYSWSHVLGEFFQNSCVIFFLPTINTITFIHSLSLMREVKKANSSSLFFKIKKKISDI